MRIAILGSVALPVPPPAQGGTEWIAYFQAKGLADLGHDVTLFAAKGSENSGKYKLVEVGKGDTVVGSAVSNPSSGFTESSRNFRKEDVYLSQVMQELIDRKDDFDVVLNNMRGEAIFLPVMKILGKKFVNVMHLPLFDELAQAFKKYNTPVITISGAQRKDFPDLNYLATVGNCVDLEKYSFNEKNGDYLLMMGSIAPHKNQAGAIEVAKKTGMKLILAGKINNQDYYKSLEKDIDGEKIKHLGELDFAQKLELYQKAKIFLFPILWPEPFGLVMIESMACGTPVVAYGNGAIPEVVKDGENGFVVKPQKGLDGLIEAVQTIHSMPQSDYQKMRQVCRKHVEENFSVDKMILDYEKALKKIL